MGKNAGDIVIAPGETQIQVFAASSTWNKPNGVRAARWRLAAGGGGGGGAAGAGTGRAAGGGGGAGGYAEGYVLAANLLSSETITVGAGGTASTGTGGTGGTSSFGAHGSATGGTGGTAGVNTTTNGSTAAGIGGTGSGGDINLSGDDGIGGLLALAASNLQFAGSGGGKPHRRCAARPDLIRIQRERRQELRRRRIGRRRGGCQCVGRRGRGRCRHRRVDLLAKLGRSAAVVKLRSAA